MNAILYLRISDRPDVERSESIELQRERCMAYCTSCGYTVMSEHVDKSISGASAENRPGLEEAIKMACKKKGVLVVYALARLARNTRDALDILNRLSACKAHLAMLDQRIDTTTPMGECFFTFAAAMAQLERRQTSQRISDAMKSKHRNGQRLGPLTAIPYGHMVDESSPRVILLRDRCKPDNQERRTLPSRTKPCPEEQAIIAVMQDLRTDRSLSEIADHLNNNGYLRRGKQWSRVTVWRVLERLSSTTAGTSTGAKRQTA